MISTILLAVSPLVVSALTGILKKIPTFENLSDSTRTPVVRLIAAVLSVAYIIFGFWMNGTVDETSLSGAFLALGYAFVTWLGSLGIFHAFFKKNG